MSSAADRKRAKEAYLASLSQQRQQQAPAPGPGPETDQVRPAVVAPPASVRAAQGPPASVPGGPVVMLNFNSATAMDAINTNPSVGSAKPTSKRDEIFEQRRREFVEQQQQQAQRLPGAAAESAVGQAVPRRLASIAEASELSTTSYARPEPAVLSNVVALKLPASVVIPEAPSVLGGRGRSSPSPPKARDPGGPGALGAAQDAAMDERTAQRHRQNEYARLLQQDQQYQHSSRPGGDERRRPAEANGDAMVPKGLPMIVNEVDNRALNRQKQEEYARQLRRDQEQHDSMSRGSGDPRYGSEAGTGHAIGTGEDSHSRAAQRRRQEEYARQLQLDQQQVLQRGRDMTSNQVIPSSGGNSSLPIGTDALSGRMLQKQKQDEYARQLEMDQLQRHAGDNRAGNLGGGNGGSILPQENNNIRSAVRNKQDAYAQQLRQDQEMKQMLENPQRYAAGLGYGGAPVQMGHWVAQAAAGNDKSATKARQLEYARLLQQDQMIKSHIAGQGKAYPNASDRQSPTRDNISVGGVVGGGGPGALPEGWVIGPLGIPVRKTIEVGHRGVQKAFNLAVQQQQQQLDGGLYSPGRPAYGAGSDFGAGSNFSPPKPSYPYSQQHSLLTDPSQQYNGGGRLAGNGMPPAVVAYTDASAAVGALPAGMGGAMDLQQERDLATKMQKLQHQKALEEQIRENKARAEKERREAERREAELQQRLDMEQQQLQLKHEQEKAQSRAEEERKRILALQIEEKKQQKEQEELATRESEERENRRIAREQQELMRREREEMERERRVSVGAVPVASAAPVRSASSGKEDQTSGRAYTPRKSGSRDALAPIDGSGLSVSPVDVLIEADRGSLFDPKPSSRLPSERLPSPAVATEPVPRPASQPVSLHEISQRPASSTLRSRQAKRADLFNSSPINSAPSPRPTAPAPAPQPAVDPAELRRMEREAALAKKEADEAKKELERMRRVLAEKERAAAEAKRQQETLLAQELREARQRFEADLAAVQAQAQAQREDEAAALASVARKTHESPLHGLFEMKLVGPSKEFHESAPMPLIESDTNNKTLKSDSRFVYPDGSAFAPSAANRKSQQAGVSSPAKHQPKSSKTETSRSPNKRSNKGRGDTKVVSMASKSESVQQGSEVEASSSSSWHELPDTCAVYDEPRPFLPPRHLIRTVDASSRDSGGMGAVSSSHPSTQSRASRGQGFGNQSSQDLFINDPGHPNAMHQLASRTSSTSHPLLETSAHKSIASPNSVRSRVVAPASGLDGTQGLDEDWDVEGMLVKNRRKLKLLMDLDDTGAPGMDELDLLLSIKEASSRPSTAASSTASSRPATVQGHSRLVAAYPHADSILIGGPPQRPHANRRIPAVAAGGAMLALEAPGHRLHPGSLGEEHEGGNHAALHQHLIGGTHETWARPSSSDLTSSRRLRSAGREASSSSSLNALDSDSASPGGRDMTLAEERELLRARRHHHAAPTAPSQDPRSQLLIGRNGNQDINALASNSSIDFSEFGF